jgi:hypothetical protein
MVHHHLDSASQLWNRGISVTCGGIRASRSSNMVNKFRLEQNTSIILYNQKFNITYIIVIIRSYSVHIFRKTKTASQRQGSDRDVGPMLRVHLVPQWDPSSSHRNSLTQWIRSWLENLSREPWVFPMKKIRLSGVNFPLASNQSIDWLETDPVSHFFVRSQWCYFILRQDPYTNSNCLGTCSCNHYRIHTLIYIVWSHHIWSYIMVYQYII